MGDFNAIPDFGPAPKLGPLMRLLPEKATKTELRGEELFFGKARCVECHYGPAFVDDYLHDGRLPTLHDAVEVFDLVLQLELSTQEKQDLVAYLLCL